ncbi:hypothetical protein ACAG26_25605 [Mycobacterium sp. pUA109]|uniref:hypothetical protein n=1 Tax=Mycobacterium sp. pUA109 TaxID=3238982 RepID=UPI00351B11D5
MTAEPRGRRPLSSWRIELKVVPTVLVALLLASAGLTAWLYFGWYRTDQRTDEAVAQAAVRAASDGMVAILSFSPETVDADVNAAKSHLTGDFLSSYDDYTRKIIAPAAKDKSVQITAAVVGAAVAELAPDSATVLVFVNQTTTSKDKPGPSVAASSVLVNLAKVGDTWLISKFEPA